MRRSNATVPTTGTNAPQPPATAAANSTNNDDNNNTRDARPAPWAKAPLSNATVLAIKLLVPRMTVVLVAGPAMVVAVPFVFKIGYALLLFTTGGHVVFSLALAAMGTVYFRNLIIKTAPTKQDAENALAQSMVLLPGGMLILASGFVRLSLWYAGINFSTSMSLAAWTIGTVVSRLSFLAAFQVSTGMVFLGMAVVARYSGSFFKSVARCSAVPLASTFSVPKDINSALLALTQPGTPVSSSPGQKYSSIRPRHPHYVSSLVQTGVSSTCGLLVAFGSVLPLTSVRTHGTLLYNADTITTCLLTVVIDTVASQLWDGRSHELDFKRYLPSSFSNQLRLSWSGDAALSMAWRLCVVPLLAAVAAHFDTSEQCDARSDSAIRTAITSLLITVVLTAYLQILDLTLRIVLVSSTGRTNLAGRVSSEDSSAITLQFLGICLSGILHSHKPLILDVISNGEHGTSEAEMRRSVRAREEMSSFVLGGRSHFYDMVPFEEDMLRLDILESLGGLGVLANCFDTMAHPLQYHHIKQWLCSADTLSGEPVAIPLIRALCAYTAGVGCALSLASKDSPKSWSLPPGAVVALECAIRATGRLLVWKAQKSTSYAQQTQISLRQGACLAPVCIDACYRLHLGMKDHIKRCRLDAKEPMNLQLYIDMIFPLSRTCDDVALGVLAETKHSQEGRLHWNRNALDSECLAWMDALVVVSQ